MITWLKRKIKQYRISNGICPYCKELMDSVYLFDGESWKSTLICPFKHYAVKYNTQYETGRIGSTIQYLEAGGAPMRIPEEYIKTADELYHNNGDDYEIDSD